MGCVFLSYVYIRCMYIYHASNVNVIPVLQHWPCACMGNISLRNILQSGPMKWKKSGEFKQNRNALNLWHVTLSFEECLTTGGTVSFVFVLCYHSVVKGALRSVL